MTQSRLRIGTRSSALARWQAQWVADRLAASGVAVDLILITTRGDTDHSEPITSAASPGVFTKELERALADGQIDLAVHSLKDLPTDMPQALMLAAVPEREDPRDVLVSRRGTLAELPAGAVVGTGSLRRQAQLLHVRADLTVRDIRGNVDTRLEKVAAGQYDAVVLAHAGLKRLGRQDQITEIFDGDVFLPAVGQGALAIQSRWDDAATCRAVAALDHLPSHQAVLAERALLAALGGGCLAPIGALAQQTSDDMLRLDAVVLSADGRQRLSASGRAAARAGLDLAADVAGRLLAQGAAELVAASRHKG